MKIDMEKIPEDETVTIVLRRRFKEEDRAVIEVVGEGNGWFVLRLGRKERTIYSNEIKMLIKGAEIS